MNPQWQSQPGVKLSSKSSLAMKNLTLTLYCHPKYFLRKQSMTLKNRSLRIFKKSVRRNCNYPPSLSHFFIRFIAIDNLLVLLTLQTRVNYFIYQLKCQPSKCFEKYNNYDNPVKQHQKLNRKAFRFSNLSTHEHTQIKPHISLRDLSDVDKVIPKFA